MNYLITGCTGFLGSRLTDHLLKKGHQIFCISKSDVCLNKGRIHHLTHDLSKRLDYYELPDHLDCIIHVAASMAKDVKNFDMFQINTLSTLDLLDFGKEIGIKKFIFISSGAVYGYGHNSFSEKSPLNPFDFYGQSKYQSELLVNYYSQQFSSTAILRLFFPYGPGQIKGLIPRLSESIKNRRPITIYNGGAPRINPIYITDVIHSIEKSLSLDRQYTFNLCGDEVTNIKELSLLIGNQLKQEPIFFYKEDKNISHLIGDNTFVKETLGITHLVSLKQGIESMF
jgi:UDP-glucose 4-epimerase